jgi:hypothetical protein
MVYYKSLLRGMAAIRPEPGDALEGFAGGFQTEAPPRHRRRGCRVHLLARRQRQQSPAPLRGRHPQSRTPLRRERKRIHPQPPQRLHEPPALRRLRRTPPQARNPGRPPRLRPPRRRAPTQSRRSRPNTASCRPIRPPDPPSPEGAIRNPQSAIAPLLPGLSIMESAPCPSRARTIFSPLCN